MDPEELRKRLGRGDRGNRYGTGGRVKIGIRSRDWPSSWESAKLACVDCKVERGEQLCRENGGVQPRIILGFRLFERFRLLAHFETGLLQLSILGARKRDRFVERQ